MHRISESRIHSWRRAALWLALVLALTWFWWALQFRVRIVDAERAPAAPPLVLRDLDGHRWELAELRGRVVLLNAWASWCGPCRREIPGLARLYRGLSARGLTVLGLNVEDLATDRLAAIVGELEIPFPVVRPEGPLRGLFREPSQIPHSWLIDRRGRVRVSHSGYLPERTLRRAVQTLLDEEAPDQSPTRASRSVVRRSELAYAGDCADARIEDSTGDQRPLAARSSTY